MIARTPSHPCFVVPLLAAAFQLFALSSSQAITSPYVTTQGDVPLNQATDDSVNGMVPVGSHTPTEGAIESLTDASSTDAPTADVILGPDNTWVGVTWDFGGTPEEIENRQLYRVDIWITGHDNLRKGYRGDLSVSLSGEVEDFTIIPNSEHEVEFSQNGQFNHVQYNFPNEFIAGDEPDGSQDQHPVQNFRYLRFNSLGYFLEGASWQSRFVEIDVWLSDPSQNPPSITLTPLPWSGQGAFRMRLNAEPGRNYLLKASADLSAWTDIDWGITEGDGSYEFMDTEAPTFSRRFYRAEPD